MEGGTQKPKFDNFVMVSPITIAEMEIIALSTSEIDFIVDLIFSRSGQ